MLGFNVVSKSGLFWQETNCTSRTFRCACKTLNFVRASTRADGQLSPLDLPDVKKLAKLAQISVTDDEVADWEPKLKEITQWFDQLRKADLDGVPPYTRSNSANMVAAGRDEAKEFTAREALLNSVPEKEGPYVKVPKIL